MVTRRRSKYLFLRRHHVMRDGNNQLWCTLWVQHATNHCSGVSRYTATRADTARLHHSHHRYLKICADPRWRDLSSFWDSVLSRWSAPQGTYNHHHSSLRSFGQFWRRLSCFVFWEWTNRYVFADKTHWLRDISDDDIMFNKLCVALDNCFNFS